ncbi:MAG: hypothetical protein LC128_08515 [Chitinophagales bacterium]|nr:hypothetical protein [Chitinophagales bacterium]
MNKVIFLFLVFCFASCKDSEYFKHKIEIEKVSDDCSGLSDKLKMDSNILGERYEFDKCLPGNFSKDNVIFKRQGDTVVVQFNAATSEKRSRFHITLDIDTYPRYNFLTIDGNTFVIIPTSP